MLRIPRKLPKSLGPRYQSHVKPTLYTSHAACAQLILKVNAKITWTQFEALRLKLARSLTAKKKLSRRTMYKQKKKEKKKTVSRWAIKRRAISWYTGFPHLAYRVKGRGSRMGKGKGNITCWYYKGRAGQIILQVTHVNIYKLRSSLYKIVQLLPVRAKLKNFPSRRWLQDEILNPEAIW